MPRSCSSGRESKYLILPASFGEMMPFVAMRASVRDVFPWSYERLAEMAKGWGRHCLRRGRECISGQGVSLGRQNEAEGGLRYVSYAFSRLLERDQRLWSNNRHVCGASVECGRLEIRALRRCLSGQACRSSRCTRGCRRTREVLQQRSRGRRLRESKIVE